jgi:hypothetical protein
MAIPRQAAASAVAVRTEDPPARAITGGGTEGNERLSAINGVILIGILAVLGLTILQIRQLLWLHLFLGMLVIGPVALKLGSTGYRFARYYTANPTYRRKGPPEALLRLMAPIVVLSTLTVLVTGVALLFAGPSSRATLLPIHKDSFIVWLAFIGIHILAHLPSLPRALRADYGRTAGLSSDTTGRAGRTLALSAALVGGLVLAVLVIPEFGAWVSAVGHSHHHDG